MAGEPLAELYQEIILDHNRRPRNYCELPDANRVATGHNPLCGDRVKVFLRVSRDRVEEISFQGSGCAICTASCSLMTEAVKGQPLAQVQQMFTGFHELLTGRSTETSAELGKLRVLEGVRKFPVRVKCATLAWHTLNAAIRSNAAAISTETPTEAS